MPSIIVTSLLKVTAPPPVLKVAVEALLVSSTAPPKDAAPGTVRDPDPATPETGEIVTSPLRVVAAAAPVITRLASRVITPVLLVELSPT